jgi:hypothetical protein
MARLNCLMVREERRKVERENLLGVETRASNAANSDERSRGLTRDETSTAITSFRALHSV